MNRVIVVIPALNEEATISAVLLQLRRQGLTRIRVVDNGSTDATATRARSAGAEVLLERRRGYGRACQAGISTLPPDVEWVLFCDADGSDDLQDLTPFFAAAASADLVFSSRRCSPRSRAALTAAQNWGNGLAVTLIRWGWHVRYTDLGPLRMIRRSALEAMRLRDQGCGWTVEMQVRAAELGLHFAEIPVHYFRRQAGRSKISGSLPGVARAGSAILWNLARLYARRLFRPMHPAGRER